MNMTDEKILAEFSKSRQHSERSKLVYADAVKTYTQFHNMTLSELLHEADAEEEAGIRWKNRKLKQRLIKYRNYLQKNFMEKTVKSRYNAIKTIYTHHEIEIHYIPPLNDKNVNKAKPIKYKDLPDKELIKKALGFATPLMKAIILFMSSSGCARRETLNLAVGDFINATKEYHTQTDIYDALHALEDRKDVIPCFEMHRQKTNKDYVTFCSPEAVTYIVKYLLSVEHELKPNEPIFKIHKDTFIRNFMQLNTRLGGEKASTFNRFRSHMLRKFHASELIKSGMLKDDVDSLQGRGKDSTSASYFFDDESHLREEYIKHMNAVTIDLEVNNLDIKSPEYIKMESQLREKDSTIKNYEKEIEDIHEKQDRLEKILLEGIGEDGLSKLNKLL